MTKVNMSKKILKDSKLVYFTYFNLDTAYFMMYATTNKK